MNEKNLERGYIDKEKILQYVKEEEIFQLVFPEVTTEYYITSPFREDDHAGCWFEYSPKGELRFVDFGNSERINGVNMSNIDCFSAVMIYFVLGNFYNTLEFIKRRLIEGKELETKVRKVELREKKKVEIYIQTRPFDKRDKFYWTNYGISKQNLIVDKVSAIQAYRILNTKYGNMTKKVDGVCYSFNNFPGNKKKLYRPYLKGSKRFLTNCGADDIGEIDSLVESGEQLVISKSYKDCRVLRNEGLNSVWFQNEGMKPNDRLLVSLSERFENIIVFYDNDKAGIEASIKIRDIINQFFPDKATNLYLPENLRESRDITDPSDLYRKMGEKPLQDFLTENKVL